MYVYSEWADRLSIKMLFGSLFRLLELLSVLITHQSFQKNVVELYVTDNGNTQAKY